MDENEFAECEESPFDNNEDLDEAETDNDEDLDEEEDFRPGARFFESGYVPGMRGANGDEFKTPKGLYQFLDDHVYGHESYKREIATFFWKIVSEHHPEGALLIAGESGSGKTEMFRVLKSIYKNIAITDGASVVPQGYKGSNTLFGAFQRLRFNIPGRPPVLVIDEFDKLLENGENTNIRETVGELLKMLEGETINVSGDEKNARLVDTSECGFVLLGSFSALTDVRKAKHIGFGADIAKENPRRSQITEEQIRKLLPPELNGRISQVVILKNFEKRDYEKILRDHRYSPIIRLSREYGVKIHVSPNKCREIAEKAFEEQTGVRSMNNEILRALNAELFEDPHVKKIFIK